MILAAIGDIAGNFSAFLDALDAIGEAGIATVVHTGNCLVGGEEGAQVVECIEARRVVAVQGEEDRRAVHFHRRRDQWRARLPEEEYAALAQAHAKTPGAQLEFLRALPRTRRFEVDKRTVFLCYGAPSSRSTIVDEHTPLMRLQREREVAVADVVICGGASAPFSRMVDGTFFVAPGPLAPAPEHACYTLIDTEKSPWRATLLDAAADSGEMGEQFDEL